MRNHPRVLGVPACAALVLATACAGPSLSLRVVNQHGKAVPGASVKTDPFTDTRLAGPDGWVVINQMVQGSRVAPIPPGRYVLDVEKLGCELREPLSIDVGSGEHALGDIPVHCKEIEPGEYDIERNRPRRIVPDPEGPFRNE